MQPNRCALAAGFSVREKLYAQLSFNIMAIIGVIAIARTSPRWALPYVALYAYGIPGIIMRHVTCPRCPHLFTYGDCLQFPPGWAKRLVRRRKTEPFTTLETAAFYLILFLLPTYPIYWLLSEPVLLVVFASCAAGWYLGQWLHFCKRCRTRACPFNRAGAASLP